MSTDMSTDMSTTPIRNADVTEDLTRKQVA
jgi:hypothetical protein